MTRRCILIRSGLSLSALALGLSVFSTAASFTEIRWVPDFWTAVACLFGSAATALIFDTLDDRYCLIAGDG